MSRPPFKLIDRPPAEAAGDPIAAALRTSGFGAALSPVEPADAAGAVAPEASGPAPRARLGELDPHLHCSVIGTCLSTTELRKLMARFLFVRDESDLEVHHEAVRMAALGGPVTKALQKALDQRHEAAVRRYAAARDAAALESMWDESLRQGDVPGAYWAVLTHRRTTPALRQRVFGDVHMLSHLVGAANRADIRRLVALERETAELRDRLERQQARHHEALDERERAALDLRRQLADSESARFGLQATLAHHASAELPAGHGAESAAARLALQTERRERAERAGAAALEEAIRLRRELEQARRDVQQLARELNAAEVQLQERAGPGGATAAALEPHLNGRRVLYVGGRASSTPAIRDLVERHGGEFQHHDGGLEDRKGLLSGAVAWAELVVFPVDCIDHDSATNLKKLAARAGVAWLPLRSAGVASLAAALAAPGPRGDDDGGLRCRHHA